jgi:hypothetical protein
MRLRYVWLSCVAIALCLTGHVGSRKANAGCFNPHAYSSSTWTSCGANCQNYDFTLTMTWCGTYCQDQLIKTQLPSGGVLTSYFNDTAGTSTWAYRICRTGPLASPLNVKFDVETDGGPESIGVQIHDDEDGDGVQDVGDEAFDNITVSTS